MKKQGTVVVIASLLSLVSSVAIAGKTSAEHDLEKLIQRNVDKNNEMDAKKYAQIAALAGDKGAALAAKKGDTIATYGKWRELKSVAEASRSDISAVEAIEAGEKHARANKEFVDLQRDILLATSDHVTVADAINALNATAPTAAGR